MPNKDTDDVLDFINSLPDAKTSSAAPKRKSESNDEFKDFLDELSAHEKSVNAPGRSKLEPKKRDDPKDGRRVISSRVSPSPSRRIASSTSSPRDTTPKPSTPATVAQADPISAANTANSTPPAEAPKNSDNEFLIDPIGSSLSLWWNTEASSKVLSLWGSLTSNATQLGESTFQFASTTSQQLSHQRHKFLSESSGLEIEQIAHLTGKLNSILSTVSQQIKDGLIDKEDELLNVFLVYDCENITGLDLLCARKFDDVMDQIEGGVRVTVSNFYHKHELSDYSEGSRHYDLGMFYGKAIDGEKLCLANLESSIKDYVKITEEDKVEPKDGEIARSSIFIAIQPISVSRQTPEPEKATSAPIFIEANNGKSFAFTMILKDITNNITIVSKSQPFPLRWARWLAGSHEDVDAVFSAEDGGAAVDPSGWVDSWIRNGLELSFAVLAQEYITNRMGI